MKLDKTILAKISSMKSDTDPDTEIEEQIKCIEDEEPERKPRSRILYLCSEIDERSMKKVCKDLIDLAVEDPVEPITMYINSPGGGVTDGLAIIDTMRAINCPVITVVTGYAASMGAIISVCGDFRFITQNAFWMAHPMTGGAYGDQTLREDRLKFTKSLGKVGLSILEKQTNIPKEILRDKMRLGELWLNSRQCLKYKVVDKIIPCKLPGVIDFNKVKKVKAKG